MEGNLKLLYWRLRNFNYVKPIPKIPPLEIKINMAAPIAQIAKWRSYSLHNFIFLPRSGLFFTFRVFKGRGKCSDSSDSSDSRSQGRRRRLKCMGKPRLGFRLSTDLSLSVVHFLFSSIDFSRTRKLFSHFTYWTRLCALLLINLK